jgi:hypothetical protein
VSDLEKINFMEKMNWKPAKTYWKEKYDKLSVEHEKEKMKNLFADYFYHVEGAHREFDNHLDDHMTALEEMLKKAYNAGFKDGMKHARTSPPTMPL